MSSSDRDRAREDQARAAALETFLNMINIGSRISDRTGAPATALFKSSAPPFAIELLSRIFPDDLWRDDKGGFRISPSLACEHINESPRPLFITAALPGRVLCAPCLASIGSADVSEWENSGCDLCGAESKTYHDTYITVGATTIHATLCGSCLVRSSLEMSP